MTVHAVEVSADPKSPRFGAGPRDDAAGLYVDWAVEDSGLCKGDRFVHHELTFFNIFNASKYIFLFKFIFHTIFTRIPKVLKLLLHSSIETSLILSSLLSFIVHTHSYDELGTIALECPVLGLFVFPTSILRHSFLIRTYLKL